jgi:hypothetical protein
MEHKFKVGCEVQTPFGNGVVVFIDIVAVKKKYLVKIKGFDGHGGGYGYDNKDGIRDKKWCTEDELTLIEPDLRELLQVGYMYITTDDKFLVDNIDVLYFVKRSRDKNLKGLDFWKDIIAIYKPKYNGLKLMEWELIWERKEPKEKLYTLQCPITDEYLYRNQLNEYVWEIIGTNFTQKEIDSLPNQDFIKSLDKKPVEGE